MSRMMPLLFGNAADPIHKIESGQEIGEGIFPLKVVLVDDLPSRHLFNQGLDFFPSKWRHTTPAGNTSFAG